MGEFKKITNEVANMLEDLFKNTNNKGTKITANDIRRILKNTSIGYPFNCYPCNSDNKRPDRVIRLDKLFLSSCLKSNDPPLEWVFVVLRLVECCLCSSVFL